MAEAGGYRTVREAHSSFHDLYFFDSASFSNVRVKGSYLVSASAVGGGGGQPVGFVKPLQVCVTRRCGALAEVSLPGVLSSEPYPPPQVTSLVGGPCVFEDIFRNGSSLAVADASGHSVPVSVQDGKATFTTQAGVSYTLSASA